MVVIYVFLTSLKLVKKKPVTQRLSPSLLIVINVLVPVSQIFSKRLLNIASHRRRSGTFDDISHDFLRLFLYTTHFPIRENCHFPGRRVGFTFYTPKPSLIDLTVVCLSWIVYIYMYFCPHIMYTYLCNTHLIRYFYEYSLLWTRKTEKYLLYKSKSYLSRVYIIFISISLNIFIIVIYYK